MFVTIKHVLGVVRSLFNYQSKEFRRWGIIMQFNDFVAVRVKKLTK